MTTFTESTLDQHCRHYRDHALPARVDPASHRIHLHIGARYGAVTMPTDLGERVLAQLHGDGLAGPVFSHPRARSWTFLTGPTRHDDYTAAAAADLFRRYATVAGTGTQIVLPSAEDERSGYRRWVSGPDTCGILPPQRAVVDAALTDTRPR